jgi:HEAT repeat protein
MASFSSAALPLFSVLALALPFLGCASGGDPVEKRELVETELRPHLEALDSKNPRHRDSARDRIGALGSKACRVLCREVKARTESGETGPGYICLLRLLGALGGEDTWRSLGTAAQKRALSPSVRIEAVRALGTLGAVEGVDALIDCAGEEEPLTIRLAALGALAPFSERKDVCGTLLGHMALGAPSVRESAAKALQNCKDPTVRDQFLARLVDIHPGVRLLAVCYFIRFPFPGATSPLETLAAHDPDVRVVLAAGKALAALGKQSR